MDEDIETRRKIDRFVDIAIDIEAARETERRKKESRGRPRDPFFELPRGRPRPRCPPEWRRLDEALHNLSRGGPGLEGDEWETDSGQLEAAARRLVKKCRMLEDNPPPQFYD